MNALRTVARRESSASLFARSFHASAPSSESAKQRKARITRQKNLKKRAELVSEQEDKRPHPVLGHPAGLSDEAAQAHWEATKLYKTMVDPNYLGLNKPFKPNPATEPKYVPSSGFPKDIEHRDPPQYLNFGLSQETASALLNDLPKQIVDLEDASKPASESSYFPQASSSPYDYSQRLSAKDVALKGSTAQQDAMERILDLRNASAQGVAYANRQRIVEAFSRAPKEAEQADTGSPEVQAALVTAQIRNLWDHLTRNPRDIHNRRSLRTLVHMRAKILRYLKNTDDQRYSTLLLDLGLEKGAVEGEIIIR